MTAPPAPSPRLPFSSINPFALAARHAASSRSSTSNGRPFSAARASRSGNGWLLLARSMDGAPSLPPWDMAEMGSVPFCRPGKPNAAWYEEAEPFTAISPKLPDLECALASLEPDADRPVPICSGGRPRGTCLPSWGALLEPMGVTTLSLGGWGRAWAFPLASLVTGRWLGEGGIERPSDGGPRRPGRAPGMGGRRRGAGADMFGCGCGEGPVLDDCIYVVLCRRSTLGARGAVWRRARVVRVSIGARAKASVCWCSWGRVQPAGRGARDGALSRRGFAGITRGSGGQRRRRRRRRWEMKVGWVEGVRSQQNGGRCSQAERWWQPCVARAARGGGRLL